MTDSSGTHVFTARDTRLTPEAVAERNFTQVKRGYAESEVRAFLRLVSDELMAMTARDRDLTGRIQALEARLAQPTPLPSDQDLIAALGEETTRVLSQAREAAVELRNKAEEHARRVVREAQESSREVRASTQQAVEARSREAEDAARARAREIVAEARALRERILNDLGERRGDLERQIAELRNGRGKLVEVYQSVERALLQATRTIAEEPAMPAPAPVRETSEPAPPAETATEVSEPAPVPTPDTSDVAEEPATPRAESAAGVPTETRDVGALFQRLRSEAEPGTPGASAPAVTSTEPAPVAEPPPAAEPAEPAAPATAPVPEASDEDVRLETADEGAAPDASDVADADAGSAADAAVLGSRDETLAPIADDLERRAKRTLQDEQNDVLDGLRRQRGKIDTSKVLPGVDEQLGRWAHVLQPSVEAAYAAGAASAVPGETTPPATRALVSELATTVVTPLRTRLEASLDSIDARSPADAEIAIAQRLGARYREWRAQDLETVLGDTLAVAYSRGVYDAAPEGSHLRWVPARVGKCPDCDDNALEPTVRGDDFPTGQPYPPAHPGCRCVLVVANPD
ncbi:MAG TPA: DivIVA domain-containing protein [Acidimicrobiia bacterium]|nr:DivIVA domain-containing protein [Acidimicrobiia bacterium]